MAEALNTFSVISTHLAAMVEKAAQSVVAVDGRDRANSSGLVWGRGIVVTAEPALEHEEGTRLTLPAGDTVPATIVGRDPSTAVAVLRFETDDPGPTRTATAAPVRAGSLVVAIGRHDDATVASFGMVAEAGGAWHSMRGGLIDRLIRLDLALDARAEGGALLDAGGDLVGMTVFGPRRRALAIPAVTIDRVVGLILAKGRVARGYLGASLQPLPADEGARQGAPRGAIIVGIDPAGPASAGGLLRGDILTTWDGAPIQDVRDVFRRLGPDSVGRTVELGLVRAGAAATLRVTIGERPSP